MFKALLLQTWYKLSDYGLEEALDDRISFRRFVGLGAGEATPDHSTFSIFRDKLREKKLLDKVFNEVNRQLANRGHLVKKGTLVDATIIEAAVKKPDQNEDGSSGRSERDVDAEWVCKGDKHRYFGYKMHASVDADSGFIRKAVLTGATTHDGHMLEAVLPDDQRMVFADKAYESKKNSAFLRARGIENKIMNKASRRIKLGEKERKRNRKISSIRQGIERVFGTLKRWYNYTRVRYVGIEKNSIQMLLLCMGFNLKKWAAMC
jgi:IS5 family transposase